MVVHAVDLVLERSLGMKFQIRQGVFETNSSSTHAIAVSTEENPKYHFPEKLSFMFGEFGWDEDCLSTVKEKASYLYTAIYYVLSVDDMEKWKKYLQFVAETLAENGVECEFLNNIELHTSMMHDGKLSFYFDIDGYIDHGTETAEFVDAVCTDKNLLLSFLFSKNSVVMTGNDNDASDITIHVKGPYKKFYKGN